MINYLNIYTRYLLNKYQLNKKIIIYNSNNSKNKNNNSRNNSSKNKNII